MLHLLPRRLATSLALKACHRLRETQDCPAKAFTKRFPASAVLASTLSSRSSRLWD